MAEPSWFTPPDLDGPAVTGAVPGQAAFRAADGVRNNGAALLDVLTDPAPSPPCHAATGMNPA